jgi:hypothetical protein
MTIKSTRRPKGQREDYQFFTNDETGGTFKVLRELDQNVAGQAVVRVSLSRTGPDGKALVEDDLDAPRLTWHTHTFTDEELRDPDFDPEVRYSEVIESLVTTRENVDNGRDKLRKFLGK